MQKAGGKLRMEDEKIVLWKMSSLLGKKEDSLPLKVSGMLVGFHLTTGSIPMAYKDTVFILHPQFAC